MVINGGHCNWSPLSTSSSNTANNNNNHRQYQLQLHKQYHYKNNNYYYHHDQNNYNHLHKFYPNILNIPKIIISNHNQNTEYSKYKIKEWQYNNKIMAFSFSMAKPEIESKFRGMPPTKQVNDFFGLNNYYSKNNINNNFNNSNNNNNNNQNSIVIPLTFAIPLGIGLSTLALCTFLGNAMVVHVIRTDKKLRTVSLSFCYLC